MKSSKIETLIAETGYAVLMSGFYFAVIIAFIQEIIR